MMRSRVGNVPIIVACALLAASVVGAQDIRCDRFQVRASRHADRLTVSLDTDCPDFSQIMVSVSRRYYKKGSQTAYSVEYFDEKSAVAVWRKPRQISVAHSKWSSILEANRKLMSRVGRPYTVASVDDNLEVYMVLPVNQKDKRFGPSNENLVGRAVQTEYGLRIVKSTVKIAYPLHGVSLGTVRLPSTDPYSLEHGQSYRLSKETPLLSTPRPADPMAAIAKMKYIPSGYVIEIVKRSMVDGYPWYRVIVKDGRGTRRGSGWVNSVALMGQELEAVR